MCKPIAWPAAALLAVLPAYAGGASPAQGEPASGGDYDGTELGPASQLTLSAYEADAAIDTSASEVAEATRAEPAPVTPETMVMNRDHRPSRNFIFAPVALPLTLSIRPTSGRAVSRDPAVSLPGLSRGSYALLDVNDDEVLDRKEFANLVAVLSSYPSAGGKWRLAPIDSAHSASSAPARRSQAAALLNRASAAFRIIDADTSGAVSRLELICALSSSSDLPRMQQASALPHSANRSSRVITRSSVASVVGDRPETRPRGSLGGSATGDDYQLP